MNAGKHRAGAKGPNVECSGRKYGGAAKPFALSPRACELPLEHGQRRAHFLDAAARVAGRIEDVAGSVKHAAALLGPQLAQVPSTVPERLLRRRTARDRFVRGIHRAVPQLLLPEEHVWIHQLADGSPLAALRIATPDLHFNTTVRPHSKYVAISQPVVAAALPTQTRPSALRRLACESWPITEIPPGPWTASFSTRARRICACPRSRLAQ